MEEGNAVIVKKNNVGLAVACGILGLCAGAAAALFLTPKSGKEMRSAVAGRIKAARTTR